jgi:hypothetical protein
MTSPFKIRPISRQEIKPSKRSHNRKSKYGKLLTDFFASQEEALEVHVNGAERVKVRQQLASYIRRYPVLRIKVTTGEDEGVLYLERLPEQQ